MDVQRLLIVLGLAVLAVGILWPMISRIGLGPLPGDIVIQHGDATFYLPIVTCIILSVVLSVALWLFNR
jgi:Protein of unknown function (DUF2905)